MTTETKQLRHPRYGPCDAFGPNGECAECKREELANEMDWLLWLQGPVDPKRHVLEVVPPSVRCPQGHRVYASFSGERWYIPGACPACDGNPSR